MRSMCMHGAACVKYGCVYSHPKERPRDCPLADRCTDIKCSMHHPRSNKTVMCRWGNGCSNKNCSFKHPRDDDTMSMSPNRIPLSSSKPCMHGERCVKYGCSYAHPPSRRQECHLGSQCKDVSCQLLHPRPKRLPHRERRSASARIRFLVGQDVEAQHTSGVWKVATVQRVRSGSGMLTLQFHDWEDVSEVPLHRVRRIAGDRMLVSENGAAESKTTEPTMNMPPGFETKATVGISLRQLEARKRAAVAQEDYVTAASIKDQILGLTHQLAILESEKQAAVQVEDFMRASQIKQRIVTLTGANTAVPFTSRSGQINTNAVPSCGTQARQDKIQFSLFSPAANRIAWH